MKPYNRPCDTVTVSIREVEVTCEGVIFYPAEPANDIDPPEPPFVEYDRVLIGGVKVNELFHGDLGDELENALVEQLEEA